MSPRKHFKLNRIPMPVLLVAAVLGLLLFPPGSLADGLPEDEDGFERVSPRGRIIQAGGGAQIRFLRGAVTDDVWVRLEVVPLKSVLQKTDDDLPAAAGSIPANLSLESAVYVFERKGQMPKALTLTIPVPEGAEPVSALDLYHWNGDGWEWLPSRKNLTRNVIEAQLQFLPEAVALMQTEARELSVSTAFTPESILPDDVADSLVTINPPGLIVDDEGQLLGEPDEILPIGQLSKLAIVPTIRNWAETGSAAENPLDAVLIDPKLRAKHIEAIIDLVESGSFQGIDLDYRDINPDLQPEFTTFLTKLRRALPRNGQLSVRLDLPRQMSAGTWDTGAYDWPAIGRIATVVKVPTLPDPMAYAPDGQMKEMMDWVVGQVERHKVQLISSANSIALVEGAATDISYEQALEQLGAVTAIPAPGEVTPGQSVNFTLARIPASSGVKVDDFAGSYWFGYLDEDNRHHTIYLENPARLEQTLQLAKQYNLQGVAMRDLPEAETEVRVWGVLQSFLGSNPAASPGNTEYEVAWRVQGQDGQVVSETVVDLSSPNYQWTAPAEGGVFEVVADVSSGQNPGPVSQGSLVLSVATPVPTPAPQPAQPAPTPQPVGPPPPDVPPVNVLFGYGIQADPRGETAANIGHIQAMGFNWVKFQMAWKDVESAPGDFSWALWDQIINAYHVNGIQILLSIPKAPDWARPADDDKSVEGPPADPFKYAEFVARVAARYPGQVQAIEIWNEQNLWYEAGGLGRISAANYVQLLQLSYQAIKSVNPDMIVVSGALTPAGNVGDAAVDDIDYLNQMYANGAKGFFDALGAHPSGFNCPVQGDWRSVTDSTAVNFRGTFDNRHHSWCFRGTMEGYREVMLANGDGDKAIIPTEFGWAVSIKPHPGYEYALDNTPEEQAEWTAGAYQLGKEWGWVGPMFLWNLDYGVTAAGTELASFGILNTPTYNTLANMPK